MRGLTGLLKHCKYLNEDTYTTHENRFITEGHIVMHTHLNFTFKCALYFSTVAIKHFKSDANNIDVLPTKSQALCEHTVYGN